MSAYDWWLTEAPPLAAALLTAAERTGARYVMFCNLYGYGEVHRPTTEDLPMAPVLAKGRLRARMWLNALDTHRAGRSRVTEVRAAAFLGAGALSTLTLGIAPQVRAGQVSTCPSRIDAPHSWSYVGDVAVTLVAAAHDDRSGAAPGTRPPPPPPPGSWPSGSRS
ncbi:Rossmann-fold NAD(P)-binding domain-containing protein [Streptomyces microflavus]|uniref:hypothetical protein n=1 Tax=Streptomyces microflavus TaxID=1919 RepID=UPI0036EEAB9F